MLTSDYIPILFKNQLSKMLKIPNKPVNHLIKSGEIVTKTIGKKLLVSNASLRLFQSKFNRDSYYSKREAIEKIRDAGFYANYIRMVKMYDKADIGFPHTYQNFKKYKKFEVYEIGDTDFVEINSLHILIDRLSEIEKNKPIYELGERIKQTNTLRESKFTTLKIKEIK